MLRVVINNMIGVGGVSFLRLKLNVSMCVNVERESILIFQAHPPIHLDKLLEGDIN